MSASVKKRGPSKKPIPEKRLDFVDDDLNRQKAVAIVNKEPEYKYWIGMAVITFFSALVRFSGIGTPSKVVFDEVHFGKFASYYLERTYFFDLHPPFAKLLIAFAGWLMGYDGSFKFENIGDDYIANNVPYVGYRALAAIQGTLTVPVMYLTMKALNFSPTACIFSGMIVAFDNAHVIDSRLILLDATLNLSVALTMFCYAKYATYRKSPFSKWWWIWLSLTGVSLSCVISTKYVGVLTYVSIGVAILSELWYWLDYKRGLTLGDFAKHFFARFYTLIVFPFIIYLFWFYLHFSILTKSGPGDAFMSSEFQETLVESPLAKFSKTVNYYDIITIKHKDTGAFLHSHDHKYPLRYEDGRISSNTQQVTAVKGEEDDIIADINNQWQIVPIDDTISNKTSVYTNDMFRLKHVGTGGYLWTHDVASPLKSTNEEITIYYENDVYSQKYNQTFFRLRHGGSGSSSNKNKRKLVKTRAIPLKIYHVDTVVTMWTHDDQLLPEWGFGHQEVSGNKKVQDKDNVWTFDSIVNLDPSDPRAVYKPKALRKIAFFSKWWELQGLMFYHNNQLSADHPFASQPDVWPLTLSGVSFWNDNQARRQIYFIGNFAGFWCEVCFLAIYLGLLLADQVSRRRNIYLLHERARAQLYNTLAFFFVAWCAHYVPFFLMNRQKFLHHYLPAHLIAALFAGGLLEFICSNNRVNSKKPWGVNKLKLNVIGGLISLGIIYCFYYFKPISFGDTTLTVEEVKKRQWFDMKLHYAK